MSTLHNYGIRGNANNWLYSFLINRQQYISLQHKTPQNVIKTVNSDLVSYNIGVPQGSILGPILFIIYVNSLGSCLEMSTFMTMYADDTSLIVSAEEENLIENKSNLVLENLYNWFTSKSLFLNNSKTYYMRFHSHQNKSELNININVADSLVERAQNIKFLGIHIDENLNFKVHCEKLISKINSTCYLIRNLKYVLTTEQLLTFYHAQINSRLNYGVCLWGCSTMAHNVFLAQKKVLRCLAGVSNTTSCRELFKKFKILTLTSVFILELAVYIYNNKNSYCKNTDIHHCNTRNKNNFRIPFFRLDIGKSSPNCIGLKIFNVLPKEVKLCKSVTHFKRKLKSILLEHSLYTLGEFFTVFDV